MRALITGVTSNFVGKEDQPMRINSLGLPFFQLSLVLFATIASESVLVNVSLAYC
jgi:hypothetical protein